MNRLTKEDVENYSKLITETQLGRVCGKTITKQFLSEMLEYKYIEEQLGLDLITYVNLTQNGFVGVVEDEDPYLFEFLPSDITILDGEIIVYWHGTDEIYCTYRCSDYGITWALTAEELKHDNK